MTFDLVSIFPRLFDGPLGEGIVRRAVEAGLVDITVHDLRDYTSDRHRSVDDVPYGGGPGMVFKPEPIVSAVEAVSAQRGSLDAVILTSPQGRRFNQAEAVRLAGLQHVVVLCGRYEGVDDRVRDVLDLDELSIGDYVLSGGELAALVIVDAVVRLIPGAVGDEQSVELESFSRGLLDYPHYTRPADFRGIKVPDVLLSGHHAEIGRWRKRQALARTLARRPDLLPGAELDDEEREILRALMGHKGEDDGRD
ncbi:MAG: tRNA (guanosine(37)-N1)-methyltransferase TrmD [Vicinamibacterales bacterium]|nr:tRNA (guanosine(37)-N1)-methyltransferase TrmD [Vicinamibacterales bacterium]